MPVSRLNSILLSLMFITAMNSSIGFAQSALFCSSLFESHFETDLMIESVVYSPILRNGGKTWIVDGKYLLERISVDTGTVQSQVRHLVDINSENFYGFAPTGAFMELKHQNEIYNQGLRAFIHGAERRVSPEESQAIQNNDVRLSQRFLDSQRLAYFAASKKYAAPGAPSEAFMRVYDATDYSRIPKAEAQSVKAKSDFRTPTEISFQKQNIKTEVFKKYREQGYQIFQIGKYVLNPKLSAAEKKTLRKEMFKWLLSNFLDSKKLLSDKVVFIINVDSVAHERTYRGLFGTEKLDPYLFDPPIAEPDAILAVELPVLRKRLLKLISE